MKSSSSVSYTESEEPARKERLVGGRGEVKHMNTGFLSGKTLSICLGLIALAVVALAVFKVSFGTLFFAGALLLCPLLHVWMMKGGEHGQTMRDGGHKH